MSPPTPSLRWAVLSDPGLRRSSNEDCYCTRGDIGLYLVADGMGGHVAGEVASRVAVDAIQAFIEETAGADKNRTWPFPFDPTISLDANRIKAAFRMANRRLASTITESEDLRGMATTASALLAGTESACVAHVGDSRVYVLRDGELSQITHDHSWVEEQVRAGTMSPTAARQHPWRNVVTRALSGGRIRKSTSPSSTCSRASGSCCARMACSRSSGTRRSPRFSPTGPVRSPRRAGC